LLPGFRGRQSTVPGPVALVVGEVQWEVDTPEPLIEDRYVLQRIGPDLLGPLTLALQYSLPSGLTCLMLSNGDALPIGTNCLLIGWVLPDNHIYSQRLGKFEVDGLFLVCVADDSNFCRWMNAGAICEDLGDTFLNAASG
jgi:hypothetical protein